jgi:hypothetical protein
MPDASPILHRDGWKLRVDPTLSADAHVLIESALGAANGSSPPMRRSRHATTYIARHPASGEPAEIYVKVFHAPRGMDAVKTLFRGSRAANTARITQALNAKGFRTARLMLHGEHRKSGRTIVVTARADGGPLVEAVAARSNGAGTLGRRRALLVALGNEVGRLHASGFIHGDLTPFNIFVEKTEPPRFVLLDHDRTRRSRIGRERVRLRNLVQLGRFDLPGVSRTDRLRVFKAYAAAASARDERAMLIRVLRMLEARRREIGADG